MIGIKNDFLRKTYSTCKYAIYVILCGVCACMCECLCVCICVSSCDFQCHHLSFYGIHRGWGLRCLDDIPKGTFVCTYTGDIHTDAGANKVCDCHQSMHHVIHVYASCDPIFYRRGTAKGMNILQSWIILVSVYD